MDGLGGARYRLRVPSNESKLVNPAQVAAITSALMIAAQVAGKATRDALFLSSFRASYLPFAMAGGAMLSLSAVLWLSRLMTRHAPASIIPFLFAASGSAFALEWLLDWRSPPVAAVFVYLHTALLAPVTLSTFWSLINERFDPHTAKSVVGRVAGGGTLGGVAGGLASWRASSVVQPGTMLLFLALVNGLATVGALFVGRGGAREEASELRARQSAAPSEGLSSLGTLRASPFLRNVASLVALGAATSALLDYIFSSQAAALFGKGQALLSFFSLFWLIVGVLSFLLQMALGRVALEKLGLAVNIAVLPGIIILGGAFGFAVPGLGSAALLRGAEAVQRNTLFRSAYELLYTPLAEERKRAAKALIDVGCDRLGTVTGSGIVLVALHAFPEHHGSVLLGAVVALGVLTLPVTRQLHLGYVAALQQGLREGAEKLGLTVGPDSHRDRIPSSVAPAREQLIQRLEALQPGGLSALLDRDLVSDDDAIGPHAAAESAKPAALVLATATELLSRDEDRARRALSRLTARDPGVPCAIQLLSQRNLFEDVQQALIEIAPNITGQLVDYLLDPAVDFSVRRRIPRILRMCSTQRAAEGLLLGLIDERFEVRYECGRALLKLTDGNYQLEISREKAIAAIECEIHFEERILKDATAAQQVQAESDDADEQEGLIDGLKRDRVNRSLEHVFTILCLHLEREPLRIAYRALHHADPKYRGTALEYLSTVLPAEIRQIVWPYLGETAPLENARPPQELLADLAHANHAGSATNSS